MAYYPQVIGVGAFGSAAGSVTHTIGGTSGISRSGDLILIFLESANQAFTPVAGYTEAPSSPQGTGTAGGANATRMTIFYKFSNGTETTYATGDSGDHNCVASMVIRGVNKLNPFNATAGNTAAANATITMPSVTTTAAECLIVLAVATDLDATSSTVFSNPVNANLTSLTERVDGSTLTGAGGGIGVYTGLLGVPGSTGTTTITQSASEETGRITLALSPLQRRISVT